MGLRGKKKQMMWKIHADGGGWGIKARRGRQRASSYNRRVLTALPNNCHQKKGLVFTGGKVSVSGKKKKWQRMLVKVFNLNAKERIIPAATGKLERRERKRQWPGRRRGH